MAQAKKIQGEMERLSNQIESTEFKSKSSAVEVTANGKNEVLKIDILDESILSSKEVVEDMITLAVNEVLGQIKKEKKDKLGSFTGGAGGLF